MSSTGKKFGLVQHAPLLISNVIEHVARSHPSREIVSKLCPGEGSVIHRISYLDLYKRTKKLANALTRDFNIKQGQVVASLAFNSYRHAELYYAVSGVGAVLHTINPRLGDEQLSYIVNHGGAVLLFVDIACLPILLGLLNKKAIPDSSALKIVCMCGREATPKPVREGLVKAEIYEDIVNRHQEEFVWPVFDENTASSLCYTSGTTGHPKGVLYSHRSTILHSLASCIPDVLNIRSNDSILVIVPLFHANAWGICYSAMMVGAKLVFPGVHVDGKSIAELLAAEKITRSLAVPTVWIGLFDYLDANPSLRFPSFTSVTIGGSACPLAMIERFDGMGVQVLHAYGLTETSPLATVNRPLPKHEGLNTEAKIALAAGSAGRGVYGIEMCIRDENNKDLPWDGKAVGELCLKGNWVTKAYFKRGPDGSDVEHGSEQSNLDEKNWFHTGDVASIDPDGYIHITDRTKDVIKSGGEWISSIDLENACLSCPGVGLCSVIAIRHAKWQERPLLLVVPKPGAGVGVGGQEELRKKIFEFLKGKVPTWWIPDAIEFIEKVPLTATGKVSKLTLRQQFKDYVFKTEGATAPEHYSPKSKL